VTFRADIRIRPMNEQDLDRVLAVAAASDEAPRWTPHDYQQILFAAPPMLRCGFVALDGDNLAGFAVVSWLPQESAAEVEGLVVDRPYRRRGMGSALIDACMTWASDAGASTVRLEVRASNAAAIALYQRHGFAAAGVRRAYYSAPREDALLLQAPVPL
jgi:[ribosomal protein S18]-alanine N-acetyltransferase